MVLFLTLICENTKSKDTEAATRGVLSKKLAALKNFAIFTGKGKHMCWSLFFQQK